MPRKLFRVEQMHGAAALPVSEAGGDQFHAELLSEIKSLRERTAVADEAAQLRRELQSLNEAINETKRSLVLLLTDGHRGQRLARAAQELAAVVADTEKATQKVLKSAEDIEEGAKTLAASLKNGHEQNLALDIQDHVIRVYEACNFQDLTGQRMTKVVNTLDFVEQHVARLIELWGRIDQGKLIDAAIHAQSDEGKMLNGPKLEGDAGHASQPEIDAIFEAALRAT